MEKQDIEDTIKAGEIASKVKKYARTIIKKEMSLLEIAEKIESKIIELGAKPAFPTNLSIDDVAAHFTPSYNDETLARGLLKIDLGVHINGWSADTAFSMDLENSEENKKLIQASEQALNNALKIINKKTTLSEIGKTIQETIESQGFSPIANLSGHSIEQYDLHSGITIPNINNKSTTEIEQGIYAIEPFATSGNGKIYEGKPSGIYQILNIKPIRNPNAKQILEFIEEEYGSLPFCSRWLVKKFGTRTLFSLRQLEQEGILHQYPQLIEISHKPVSQTENTILITKDKKIITTE